MFNFQNRKNQTNTPYCCELDCLKQHTYILQFCILNLKTKAMPDRCNWRHCSPIVLGIGTTRVTEYCLEHVILQSLLSTTSRRCTYVDTVVQKLYFTSWQHDIQLVLAEQSEGYKGIIFLVQAVGNQCELATSNRRKFLVSNTPLKPLVYAEKLS